MVRPCNLGKVPQEHCVGAPCPGRVLRRAEGAHSSPGSSTGAGAVAAPLVCPLPAHGAYVFVII